MVLLIILVFGVRGCLNAREAQGFRDYVAEVDGLVGESDQQGEALFDLLDDPSGQSSVDVENTVNGFRVEAEQLVERARGVEVPDEAAEAQRYLVETLQFRADGLGQVASQLPAALGDEGHAEAARAVAGQMQSFLASDVIYSQRVIPGLQSGASEVDVLAEVEPLPESQFLPDLRWLDPKSVTDSLATIRSGGAAEEPASPGLHGNGLGSVTMQPGGEELAEGGTTVVAETQDLAFDVQVENQGESEETNVGIRIDLEPSAGEPIQLQGEIDTIGEGETVTATIPLVETPPTNEDVNVSVEIEGVPGEDELENNEASYTVRFGG